LYFWREIHPWSQALSNLEVKMMVKCFEISLSNRSIKAEKLRNIIPQAASLSAQVKNLGPV
jgi:hypothetical protein